MLLAADILGAQRKAQSRSAADSRRQCPCECSQEQGINGKVPKCRHGSIDSFCLHPAFADSLA